MTRKAKEVKQKTTESEYFPVFSVVKAQSNQSFLVLQGTTSVSNLAIDFNCSIRSISSHCFISRMQFFFLFGSLYSYFQRKKNLSGSISFIPPLRSEG